MKHDEQEVTIELVKGVEGQCLIINGYRVAGPKPWGGGVVTKTWKTTVKDIKESTNAKRIKMYHETSR